ncbi:MAG: nitrilase-related carbon-nitrogen hydrolase [Caldilineaceae bacterium]
MPPQYPVEFIGTWTRYAQKVSAMVEDAAGQGAALLVFPEYASLELASLFPAEVYGDIHKQLDALQELLPRFRRLFCETGRDPRLLHRRYQFSRLLADGTFVNRAYVCRPDASFDFQDKLIMARFETEQWHITPGRKAKVFAARFGRFAVNICYDAEFPLLARRQVEAGADLIVVPTCTDTHAGYYRVQTGSARRPWRTSATWSPRRWSAWRPGRKPSTST